MSDTDSAFLQTCIRITMDYILKYEQKVAQRVNVGYYRQELAGLYERLKEYKSELYGLKYA